MMFKVLIVLAATVYATVAQTKKCSELPRQTLDFPGLVVQSPFQVVFSLDTDYACATVFYTTPVPGSSYDLGSTYNLADKVLANLELTMNTKDPENNQSDSVKFCSADGKQDKHNFLKLDGVDQSLGYCIFTCDGDAFSALKCMSRGGSGLTDAAFAAVLQTVQGVANGPRADATLSKCAGTGAKTCSYFTSFN